MRRTPTTWPNKFIHVTSLFAFVLVTCLCLSSAQAFDNVVFPTTNVSNAWHTYHYYGAAGDVVGNNYMVQDEHRMPFLDSGVRNYNGAVVEYAVGQAPVCCAAITVDWSFGGLAPKLQLSGYSAQPSTDTVAVDDTLSLEQHGEWQAYNNELPNQTIKPIGRVKFFANLNLQGYRAEGDTIIVSYGGGVSAGFAGVPVWTIGQTWSSTYTGAYSIPAGDFSISLPNEFRESDWFDINSRILRGAGELKIYIIRRTYYSDPANETSWISPVGNASIGVVGNSTVPEPTSLSPLVLVAAAAFLIPRGWLRPQVVPKVASPIWAISSWHSL
jgi:hypothetical protein